MKKIFGLVLLSGLLLAGTANAATFYRVDFSGILGDGTYNGFFFYDADLAINPDADQWHVHETDPASSTDGFETDLEFNYDFSGGAGSFDETNAGVGILIFNNNVLSSWAIGGDERGVRSISSVGILDFSLGQSSGGRIKLPGQEWVRFDRPIWEQTQISAVPLPAAVWAFGAGLVALFGLLRRRKAKSKAELVTA